MSEKGKYENNEVIKGVPKYNYNKINVKTSFIYTKTSRSLIFPQLDITNDYFNSREQTAIDTLLCFLRSAFMNLH